MMSYWERLHPVNAVHVAEVSLSQVITPCDLTSAVQRLFEKFHAADPLGRWPLTVSSGDFSNDEVLPQRQVQPLPDIRSLESLVGELLNQPFADDEPPFRVGLTKLANVQYVWLAYRHSIADGRSIALLMQNLLEELYWPEADGPELNVERTAQPLSALFPTAARYAARWGSVGHSLKTLWSLRRCHRRPPADPESFRMSFQIHAEDLPLATLRERAKDWGATVGELMLAAMLDWFVQEDRAEPFSRWSPNRCVSVLADLAGRAEPKQPRLFGQYLSPLNIMVNSRRVRSFGAVVQSVRAMAHPTHGIAKSLRSLCGLSVNAFLVSRCPRAFANWYQERLFPVSGALSNVNLNSVLPAARTPLPLVNYFRGTCATQFSPMILCLTTVGDACTITTTHRDTVYSADEMQALVRHVMRHAFGVERQTPREFSTKISHGLTELSAVESGFGTKVPMGVSLASPGC